jgi:hypothetical protein
MRPPSRAGTAAAVATAAACVGLAGPLALAPIAAGAKTPPTTIARSCPAVRVAGRTIGVDVISGPTTCANAGAAIGRFVAGKPVVGRSRSLTVARVKLTCRSYAAASGFAWRYICISPTFAATGGGRLLPAANYRKL